MRGMRDISFCFALQLGNCDVCMEQKISVINEMKYRSKQKFRTEKTFVEYCELLLKLWANVAQLSAIFLCMIESL